MITHSGGKFDLLDPRPEDVRALDVATALSRLCRYGGHTCRFYSVAEHCIRLSRYVQAIGLDLTTQRVALLHDGEEAYARDIPTPLLSVGLPGGQLAEVEILGAVVRAAVFEAFGLDPELANYPLRLPVVHELDLRIRANEVHELFPPSCAWLVEGLAPLESQYDSWQPGLHIPELACAAYAARLAEIGLRCSA